MKKQRQDICTHKCMGDDLYHVIHLHLSTLITPHRKELQS